MNQTRHSRAGGNPAKTHAPQSEQNLIVAPHCGDFIINWIPACAGMTTLYSQVRNKVYNC